jgi:hypothetical protein
MEKIKAGASKVDITPPLGTIINGDFISHYARHVHDTMYAKAIVLKDPNTTVAICVVDICAMKRSLLDEVKKQVQQQTGIPANNILISSTHTHASGSVESLLLGAADLPYRQKLKGLIVEAIVKAFHNLVNVDIGFGALDVPEYVLCRRYVMEEGYEAINPVTGQLDKVKTNPFGAEKSIVAPVSKPDCQVCYIAIKNEDNEWLAVLANYSLHYVGDWENGTISPDYFGEFSKQLKIQLGASEDFVAIMSNGTSGEVNIWDFMNAGRFPKVNFEKSRLIGGDIADRLVLSVPAIEWQSSVALAAGFQELPINVRKPDASTLLRAKEIVSTTDYEDAKGTDFETMQQLYARELVLLNDFSNSVIFPLQALKIGNIVIGALGGEFFAETGLTLKREIPHRYFTITLANDYVGYVCPAHEIEKGGYETWLCRTSCLDIRAEQDIRIALLGLIKSLQ